MENLHLSLMFPEGSKKEYRQLSDMTMHDLGFEEIVARVTKDQHERKMIFRYLSRISPDAEVIRYRSDIFEDIMDQPAIRERMKKLLEQVDFIKTYGSFHKESDSEGIWQLAHRMEEMYEYIECVEAIRDCLDENVLRSEGLLNIRRYVTRLYEESGYDVLKKDIESQKEKLRDIKSVTLGVNLNDRFEANGIGIVSLNRQVFTKSGVISGFCDHLRQEDQLKNTSDWDGQMKMRVLEKVGNSTNSAADPEVGIPAVRTPMQGIVHATEDSADIMRSLNRTATTMLHKTAKRLSETISKYVTVSTYEITALIPEFLFYVRMAEYVESLRAKGFDFCKASLREADRRSVSAEGIYNLKLTGLKAGEVTGNDLEMDDRRRLCLLTGANRGGKTTYTQAVGAAYLMAQNGVYVPAVKFEFSPVDYIGTHFPADENKTMDLGRLGEEAERFRELYRNSTSNSILLLNESFSTTSFEEGYYIARDAVRALCERGISCIYNTHLHKLALDLEDINRQISSPDRIASLTAESSRGTRSYRIIASPPQGTSFARDIAVKYGVTFEQLMEDQK